MSDNAVQQPASATGTAGHEQYQSLKQSAAGQATNPSETGKPAPDAEPEKEQQEQKGLTDQQKADRKRRNDERRAQRWYEERGAMRAELNQLRQELADLKGQSRTREDQPVKGEPQFDTYLNSGKYRTWEEAQQAWMKDTASWLRDHISDQVRTETSRGSAEQDAETVRREFQKNIREFSRTHEDFQDAMDAVQEALDGPRGEGNPVTTYIVRSKDAPLLIYHLGNNPEILESLADMDPDDAIAELGAIRKELKARKPPDKETPSNDGARAPKELKGRETVVDANTAMKQAADKGDFAGWQKAYRASKNKTA